MRRRAAILPLVVLAGCAAPAPSAPLVEGGIVSLDYCADQMVLGLAPREQILAVSPEAASDASFAAPRARGLRVVRPVLEEVTRLRPRYAVRLYGGAPGLDRQLRALGITVVQLGVASSLGEVPAELARVGGLTQTEARAAALVAAFRADLAAAERLAAGGNQPRLLYVTPGDVTSGSDGFVGDVMAAAGFRSVRSQSGWGSLPIEAMVRRPPDAVLRAFFDSPRYQQDRWATSRHPRLQTIIAQVPGITVPGSALACGNWLAGDAVRQLAALRAQIAPAT